MTDRLQDERFMTATLRYAERHLSLTGTNPSVGTLIVSNVRPTPVIVGRGITAIGGRPHAETIALQQAGEKAKGATAYVTLEPCAHHASTPPCAQALIDAGVARVVTAFVDPDARVDGKGHAMLKAAGISVTAGICSKQASRSLAGYLSRVNRHRPQVTLKLALSADDKLGLAGNGQVKITGAVSNAQVHLMRAASDAILIGSGTALADNPSLTCRLPGLEARSSQRFILDTHAVLPAGSNLVTSAGDVRTCVVSGPRASDQNKQALLDKGVAVWAGDLVDGQLALPELLEDMAAQGISTLMVEGGAQTAVSFLEADLVDALVLFKGPNAIGENGIASPVTLEMLEATYSDRFQLTEFRQFGEDTMYRFERSA